jgi:hypothetical protein
MDDDNIIAVILATIIIALCHIMFGMEYDDDELLEIGDKKEE